MNQLFDMLLKAEKKQSYINGVITGLIISLATLLIISAIFSYF